MSNLMTQRKVLVLNKGSQAIAVISLERAMGLICATYRDNTPKAEIVDVELFADGLIKKYDLHTWEEWAEFLPKDGEPVMKSANRAFRIPEIVKLTRYNRLPQQRVHFSRRTIYRRDGNQCVYCGAKPGTNELSIDHVIPRSKGGKTTWDNCVIACTKCNKRKADRTLKEAGMKFFDPRYKPTKPKFTFYKGDYRCDSWQAILGVCYWESTLENDMDDKP